VAGFSEASGADDVAALLAAAAPFFIEEMYLLSRSILCVYRYINRLMVLSETFRVRYQKL